MNNKSLLLTGSVAMVLAAGAASAQEQRETGLEEVIVTAQKRVESAQNVPISIAAVDAAALESAGIENLDQMQRLTPGMTISNVGSGFVSYTYIRGAGTNVLTSDAEPSVAYYMDEVYLAGTAGLQSDLLDIERIEVLKGPQGTLFGRNAAAGAVSITTKRAEDTFNSHASADLGNYGAWGVKGGVTGPLSDDQRWRYRFAVGHRERDAFTDNLSGGLDPGFLDTTTARATLEFVDEGFTARLTADYFTAENGMTNQIASTAYAFCTDLMNAAACASLPPGSLPPAADLYEAFYDVNGFEDQDTWSVTARLEWELPFATLTSISSYRDNSFDRLADYDATALNAFVLGTDQQDETFGQELRLSNVGEKVDWIAGLYYYESATLRVDRILPGPAFVVPAFAALPGSYQQDLDVTSYAAFGQLTYHFTDELGMTLGGRYTRDEKQSRQNTDPFGPVPRYAVNLAPEWSSFDPAISLQYQMNPQLLLYASARQGFKSGGFQSLAGNPTIASSVYDPEEVRSYELGMKSRWLDDRLQLNLAAFHTDIDDQQILRLPVVGVTLIDNAGQTSTDGVDISVSALATPNLRFDINATLQKARFDQYISNTVSFKGNHQLRSPDETVSLLGEYTLPLGAAGELVLRADYAYQSEVFFDAANTSFDGANQGSYGLVNGRVTFVSANDAWDVSLYGKNLADEEYYRNVALQGRFGLAVPGDPRTYGVTFNWRYR